MDKYISVITNFGCHYSCPYCIVKNNNLNIPKSTLGGLDNLKHEIEKNDCNWISLSGGGDPLFQYEQHKDWYEKFFGLLPENIKIELHTSYTNHAGVDYSAFDRVVYHLQSVEQLEKIKKIQSEIVRVVYVVTEDFTEDIINKIAIYCSNSEQIDELSFRQMVDDHYEATDYCKEYLRQGHQRLWWYIEQCDYNLYYCENKVYMEYQKIGEQT